MVTTDALYRIALDAEEAGDLEFALRSYERGAALGDGFSLFRLGLLYDEGELGMEQDKLRALHYYRRAWRRSCPGAANNIAVIYREQGKHRLMFQWFKREAEAGDGGAYLNLAKCYLEGIGVRKDVQAGIRCLAVAIGSERALISEAERDEAAALMNTLRPRIV